MSSTPTTAVRPAWSTLNTSIRHQFESALSITGFVRSCNLATLLHNILAIASIAIGGPLSASLQPIAATATLNTKL